MTGTGSEYSESTTVLLPDGGTIVGSTFYAPLEGFILPVVSVQRYDASGNTIGPGYEQQGFRVRWRDFSVAPMTDGGYAVGYVNYSASSVFLSVLRFGADGTLLGTIVPSSINGPPLNVWDYEIASLPNGNFLVAWSQSGELHVREFNAAAQPVTPDRSGLTSQVVSINAIDVFPEGD